jgi:hypothetical protein
LTNSKKTSQKTKKTTNLKITNTQLEDQLRHGKFKHRLKEIEDREAEEEMAKYRIPPCIGHAFEEE